MSALLTDKERQTLLHIARVSIENAVKGNPQSPLEKDTLAPALRENGASFVTLTVNGELRGCIGALEAYQPLAEDVREHAVAAALNDPRFPVLREAELSRIQIEVSYLTKPQELQYLNSQDLLAKLQPHVDGVILEHGFRRATFLPQVWEKIPEPEEFISQLCYKMGERSTLWRETKLQVYVYQVEEFHEMN